MFLDSNITFTNSTIKSTNLEQLNEHDKICSKIAKMFNLYNAKGPQIITNPLVVIILQTNHMSLKIRKK